EFAAAVEGQARGIGAGRELAWPGENSASSIRSEFKDRLCAAVGRIEIARAVESQALACLQKIAWRSTGNGAEHDPLSVRRELEDSAGFCGTPIIIRHDIDIAGDVYGEAYKAKLSGAANGADVVAQVKFQHSPNFNVLRSRLGIVCREEIADAVKGQASRVI